MDLDYDEIMRLYRLEKNSSKPAEIDESFFHDLGKFFKKEKAEYLRSLKDITSSRAKSFSNLRKIIEEIFSLREKKLLNKALIASRTGELENGRLAVEEKETLKQLLNVLNSHRLFLDRILGVEQEKSSSAGRGVVAIKLLQNVPAFVGADMQEYGPFQKGKVARVPAKIASLLVARKLAEKRGRK
mgnify:CR=1 FL=1